MQDVMIDLETLGNRPGCVILSIGAVGFDPETGELGPEFYAVISKQSCIDATLHVDSDTLAWWMKQSPEARKVLSEADAPGARPLGGVLSEFAAWLSKNFGPDVRPWGNGSDFDNAILAHAYRAVRQRQPWKFWNARCHRTLKELRPHIKIERTGVYHNALDDALDQAMQALKVFADLNGNRAPIVRLDSVSAPGCPEFDTGRRPTPIAADLDEEDLIG